VSIPIITYKGGTVPDIDPAYTYYNPATSTLTLTNVIFEEAFKNDGTINPGSKYGIKSLFINDVVLPDADSTLNLPGKTGRITFCIDDVKGGSDDPKNTAFAAGLGTSEKCENMLTFDVRFEVPATPSAVALAPLMLGLRRVRQRYCSLRS
jgi:hypothetical protein